MEIARLPAGTRTITVVTGGHFLSHFYLLVFPPLFPILRDEFTLTNTELGLIISVISLATLLQMPAGHIVDRIGAKHVFVTGVGLTGLGVVLAGLSPSYPVLLAFAALSGLGQSAFHPADYPLIEAVSDPDRKGRNFSIHTFGGFVGFAVAPVVVGTLGILYDWRIALVATGSIGVAYAVVAWAVLGASYREDERSSDTSAPDQPGLVAVLARPGIIVMFLFFMVIVMANRGIQTFVPLLALDGFALLESVGNTALSVYFGLTAVGILVGGMLADRFDPRYVILGTLTVAAGTMWLLVSDVLVVTATVFVVLFAVMGGAHGLVFAPRDRLVSSLSVAGSTGRSFGFVFTGTALGGLVSPVILGVVIDFTEITLAFVLVGGFFLLAGLVALVANQSFPSLGVFRGDRAD